MYTIYVHPLVVSSIFKINILCKYVHTYMYDYMYWNRRIQINLDFLVLGKCCIMFIICSSECKFDNGLDLICTMDNEP